MTRRVSIFGFLLCAPLLLSVAPTHAAELKLVYERLTTESPRGEKASAPAHAKQTRATITVGLGNQYIYEMGSDSPTQIDFEHRRLRSIQEDRHTFVDAPLYAVVAFREMEIRNRLALRQSLGKRKIKDARVTESVAGLEAEFGIKSEAAKDEAGDLKSEKQPGAFLWRIGGDTATVCTFSDTALTPPQEAMFRRYLIYFCKIHPEVRAALLAQHHVPRRLTYRWNSLGTITTVELTLTSMAATADSALRVPDGLTAEPAFDSTLSTTLKIARDSFPRCRSAAANTYEAMEAAKKAAGDGRALDALLGLAEYTLMTSGESPALDDRTQALVRKDAKVKRYTDAIEKLSKGKLHESATMFEAIDRSGLEKGYLIDLEIATAHGQGGDPEGAETLFQNVVRTNPCIVGAWTDLAITYINSFDTFSGWICLDAARHAATPGCALLQKFDAHERDLARKYPEFF
jgi:hypothetical protein